VEEEEEEDGRLLVKSLVLVIGHDAESFGPLLQGLILKNQLFGDYLCNQRKPEFPAVKVSSYNVMKACRGSRDRAPLIPNLRAGLDE
jgi:hypothetical protein